MTQHGDRIMHDITTGLWIILAAVIATIIVLIVVGRWRERRIERDAAHTTVSLASVPERTVEEIAASDVKTLEEWLAEDPALWLRTCTVDLQTSMIDMERRVLAAAEIRADLIARRMLGHRDGLVGLRADLLIDACHHDRAELIDLVNTTCAWPQEWEDELADLLTAGVSV